jgi:beta-lactamase class A
VTLRRGRKRQGSETADLRVTQFFDPAPRAETGRERTERMKKIYGRRTAAAVVLAAVLLSGCGKPAENAAAGSSSDGLAFSQETVTENSAKAESRAVGVMSESSRGGGKTEEATGAAGKSVISASSANNPKAESRVTGSRPQELTDLEEQIRAAMAGETTGATRGSVYVEELDGTGYAWYDSRAVQTGSAPETAGPMQAASLIKLYIAGAVWEQISAVRALENGEGETDSLLLAMLAESDNTAANTLTSRLGQGDDAAGRQAVNDYCKRHGYADTHMGRMLLESNASDDNYTSVRDCSRFLKNIWLSSGEAGAADAYAYETDMPGAAQILQALEQQVRTGKIPAGVPSGVKTANKTGELDDVQNDAAIVFLSDRPYCISVMIQNVTASGTAIQTITQVSADVYQYMSG